MITDNNDSESSDLERLIEFGAAIRSAREAHGKSLESVSGTLRIRQAYLAAMEDGRFEDLPGPTYAAGFVKAYSDYLGLDTEEVMQQYREGMLYRPSQNTIAPPMPVVERRLPTGFILLISGVVVVLVYGGWYYITLREGDTNIATLEVPAKIPKELKAKKSQNKGGNSKVLEKQEKQKSVFNRASSSVVNNSLAHEDMVSRESKNNIENAPELSSKQIGTPAKRKAPEVKKSEILMESISQVATRVSLRANAASWVELRRSNGDRLISQILSIGETFNVPREKGIRLTTGNAGGIDILIDGQLLAPLGPLGAVRRDVILDPDSLRKRLDRP